jgi:hypothetical protein
VSLDYTVPNSVSESGLLTLADTIADPVTVEATVFEHDDAWDDLRIARVLAMLSPDEGRVAAAYSASDDVTWGAAAHASNMPASFGERVRRKLRRLGRQFAARYGSLKP